MINSHKTMLTEEAENKKERGTKLGFRKHNSYERIINAT